MSLKRPPKWYEVYPKGTSEGDEEVKFFKALARNPLYKWRTTSAIAKESGLSKKRTEEIISKYVKLGVVVASKKNENNWAYWESVPKTVENRLNKKSIAQKDKDARVKGYDDDGLCSVLDPQNKKKSKP